MPPGKEKCPLRVALKREEKNRVNSAFVGEKYCLNGQGSKVPSLSPRCAHLLWRVTCARNHFNFHSHSALTRNCVRAARDVHILQKRPGVKAIIHTENLIQ